MQLSPDIQFGRSGDMNTVDLSMPYRPADLWVNDVKQSMLDGCVLRTFSVTTIGE
jgi:hypothetical protein